MAFPLKFADEEGVIRTYWWFAYPLQIARVPSAHWTEWTFDNLPEVAEIPYVVDTVYCGPPSPCPHLPTHQEFLDGMALWLSR